MSCSDVIWRTLEKRPRQARPFSYASERRNVPPVTEPVKSLGVSLAEDEKGRGAAELQVGDARYVLDRDQVDYLIHALIRMRRSIQQYDAAPQS